MGRKAATMSEYIIEYLPDTTSIEREEIVRCRDCVEYEPYHTYAGMKLDYGNCMKHERETNDDRFCWWGERRANE
jgi:hypothetical protein